MGVTRTADHMHTELDEILTESAPFGPLESDGLFQDGLEPAQRLFDRSNLICAQTQRVAPPYIVGRKGAGKTTFLLGTTLGAGLPTETLQTSAVYSEMITVIRRYGEVRGPLFVDQVAEIWLALFDHVALSHAYHTAGKDEPPAELQLLWDYLGAPQGRRSATTAAELFLNTLTRRINDVARVCGL